MKRVALSLFIVFFFSIVMSSMALAKQEEPLKEKETKTQKIDKDTKGVFSTDLLDEIGRLMDEFRANNPGADEDEVVRAVAEQIADTIGNKDNKNKKDGVVSTSDYLDNLITGSLGPTEKQVFNSNPLFGSYVLADAKLAKDSAEANYTDLHNGKGDAYRHGLWQGLSAFHTTKAYAKAFGDAHEKDFPGPQIETEMDLFNNSVGRDIGASKWFIWTVYSGVKDGVTEGKFKYIKNGVLVWTNR